MWRLRGADLELPSATHTSKESKESKESRENTRILSYHGFDDSIHDHDDDRLSSSQSVIGNHHHLSNAKATRGGLWSAAENPHDPTTHLLQRLCFFNNLVLLQNTKLVARAAII